MCEFLSGVVTMERYPRILCADLRHHERTVEAFGLKPETYREWEWIEDDDGASLMVRAIPDENPNVLKSAILAKYPTREKVLNACIAQALERGGSLDLSGRALPDGLLLPESMGGSLYLCNCKLPAGLVLPKSIGGWLNLSGCTLPVGLTMPETIGGWLDLCNCKLPAGLTLPKTIGGSLDLSDCLLPIGLTLPETIGSTLYLHGCTLAEGLTLDLSKYCVIC